MTALREFAGRRADRLGRVSAALLQKRFVLGSGYAARLLERLTELGYLRPASEPPVTRYAVIATPERFRQDVKAGRLTFPDGEE